MRNLLVDVITQYNDGTGIKRKVRTIFAEKKSASREEFYKAYAVGTVPKYIFSFDQLDFKSCDVYSDNKKYHPTHVRFEGEEFEIVRSFEIGMHDIEVTVK